MTRRRTELAAVFAALLLFASPVSAEEEPAGDDTFGFRWIPPSGYVDDWVFLLQAYYSGLDGIGAGLELSRPFTVPGLSQLTDADVEIHARGRLYEQAHGEVEISAESAFAGGDWLATARFDHSTRLRRFWGVGPDLDHDDREQFRPRDLRTYFELLRRVTQWRFGARVELHDYMYLKMQSGGLLESGLYPGVTSTGETVAGLGLTARFDSRDDRYRPRRGWWVQSLVMRFDGIGDAPSFWNTFLDVRNYRSLSRQDVLALQFFTYGVDSGAPVWRYAALGGREHSRGYSRNRYLDRRMVALQAEWRRPVFWRLDAQLFGGLALVTPQWSKTEISHLHPTVGAGLSVHVPEVSDVAIRGDLAIGDESLHGELAIGYAF